MSQDLSFIANAHPNYIEKLYDQYTNDPESIDEEWRVFFAGFEFASGESRDTDSAMVLSPKEFSVLQLILAYRAKGHLISDTNPIKTRKDRHAYLNLSDFGLDEADLDTEFYAGQEVGLGKAKLSDILALLKRAYARTIGFEYDYIVEPEEKAWFTTIAEKFYFDYELSLDKKRRVLRKLNDTSVLEKFLHTKFIGQKRFSLEGGESTIPALDAIINKSASLGVKEVAIGMAHRGRLNVLTNIMQKTYENVFSEFEKDTEYDVTLGDGDVKYHLGYSSIYNTMEGDRVYLKLMPNPSHLEAVGPVVEGFCRAKADAVYNSDYDLILPIIIHGDAAVAGQGVVYETLQMSGLKGYKTGGTIHFIINNQIGFTTDFDDARTSNYSTSVASTTLSPVIHVNGDDVEAVVFASEVATAYRQKFNKDIFVDMVCYRRHGHNEGDDPQYTQPQMYSIIKNHMGVRDRYSKYLTEKGQIEAELVKSMDKRFWSDLQDRLEMVKEKIKPYEHQGPELAWKEMRKVKPVDFLESPETAISKEDIVTIVKGLIKMPEGFQPIRKVQKMLASRRLDMRKKENVDWAAAELLAYGSILLEGKDVRMSGQDVKRGTFSHRHAMIYDENTGEEYNRLNYFVEEDKQGKFRSFNSHLSEYAVLGFEYGYSVTHPDVLTIWEAQFGDFANGAQVMIDQFISSSESKWNRQSGIVMLLPHGYEGMGPEHSSAKLERFLQLCAEFNMAVVNCTKPANFFHAIRRQMAWPFRIPLIVMSPKSLLRHPKCVSDIADIYTGKFEELIDDKHTLAPAKVKKLLFCSGKVYYDLLAKKEADKRKDIAIVRIEQLYPLPFAKMDEVVKKYENAEYIWVQEEPSNMGAWAYMRSCYRTVELEVICRKSSASPATGYAKLHQEEQEGILRTAFGQ
ncbi:MAG: 2-oxoglutarate dehydrogenase E1 component [Bacteroidetes bacterium]|nr:2-oxoglutarate dehydrogenase E1 component [Bacteroidota bacterium]